MFVIKYLGSTVNIMQPSTITVTPTGVEVTPLEARIMSALKPVEVKHLDALGEALEVAGVLSGHKRGRKVDPNSVRQRVFAATYACLEGRSEVPKSEVLAYVREQLPDVSEAQILDNVMVAKIKRDNGKWSPIGS